MLVKASCQKFLSSLSGEWEWPEKATALGNCERSRVTVPSSCPHAHGPLQVFWRWGCWM